MILPLMKKLRSILSNNKHCLKQAFQERTLPKVNQQPCPKFILRPNSNHKISFFFQCQLLTQQWRFLRPKAFNNFLLSSLPSQKRFYYSLYRCVHTYMQAYSFSMTILRTHQNPPRTWQNRLKNPLKLIAILAKTVSDTKKTFKNKDHERDFAKLRCLTVFNFFFV